MKKGTYVVITGASQGLGKCFAEVCAEKGMNLILTALHNEGIHEQVNSYRSRFGIEAYGYEADLTSKKELAELCDWINRDFNIEILINNAGAGGARRFREVSGEYIENMISLNINALVMITYRLLPNLEKQKQSYILNIASIASFGPMPYKTVYPASKAFVYSFSRGLYSELKKSGVFVSVAHPGGMATNCEVSGRINQHNRLIKSTILSPRHTAEICINQLLKKDALIIPGFMNKVSWLFFQIFPVWLRLIVLKRSLQKEFLANE